MPSLDNATCRRLLTEAAVARLATVTADGAPHVVPCCFLLDGDRLYSVVDGKPKSTTALRRLDNVRTNPLVSLVADHYADDWQELWWVRVDGAAVVVDDDRERATAIDGLAAKYHQYREQTPTGPLLRVGVNAITGRVFNRERTPTVS